MAKVVDKIFKNDLDTFLPIGLKLPIGVGVVPVNYKTLDQIRTNLQNLILTMYGERPFQPDFGCDLYRLLFEPLDTEELSIAATKAIKRSVNRWMSYVTIINVKIQANENDSKSLIRVIYKADGVRANQTMNLAVKV